MQLIPSVRHSTKLPEYAQRARALLASGRNLAVLPSELEALYWENSSENIRSWLSTFVILGVGVYGSYIFVDWYIVATYFWVSFGIRFLVCAPLVLGALVFIRSRDSLLKYGELSTAVGVVVIALSVLLIQNLADQPSMYNTGPMVVIVFSNVLFRLKFRYSMASTVFVAVVYVLSFSFGSSRGLTTSVLALSDHLVLSGLSLLANYGINVRARAGFLQALVIEDDRSRLEEANKTLERWATTDPLTGLYNRRYFGHYINDTYSRLKRLGKSLSVLFMDVDFFKRYNDHYGHLEGDTCLRELAQGIKDVIRDGEICARYGGEEFVVLLEDAGEDQAKIVAQRIRSAVRKLALPHASSDAASRVTLSIGIASGVPDEGCTVEALLRAADDALYRAKSMGRDRVEVERVGALEAKGA